MSSKAFHGQPPLQPWLQTLPYGGSSEQPCEQSTISCSLNEVSGLPAMAQADSITEMVEKAQHEPHWPWSLMGSTTGGVWVR